MSSIVNLCLTLVAAAISHKCNAQQLIDDWISELDQINKPELDKDWRDDVDKLGGEYEEVPHATPRNDEDDFKYLKEFVGWRPMSPGEVPYLAILYAKDNGPSQQYKEFFKGDPDPGPSHVEPGTACGGSLISPKHVLTMCGCLFQVIQELIFDELEDLFGRYDPTPKYRIKSHLPGAPAKVFVTFSLLRFVPDFAYEVDEDKSKWPKANALNCRSFIKVHGSTSDMSIRARRADGELIAVPLKKPTEFGLYPTWPPPFIINKQSDPTYKEEVTIASIGMRLIEKTKLKFQSSVQVSSLEAQHCPAANDICRRDIWDTKYTKLGESHVCFCPTLPDQRPQLVGGTIGWPVVGSKGNLVGLTASERRPADGTLVVAMITKEYVELIEAYVGKSVLENQNSRPNVYREKDLNKDFLIYDYWAKQFRTPTPPFGGNPTPGGKSGATQFGPKMSDSLIAIFCFLRI